MSTTKKRPARKTAQKKTTRKSSPTSREKQVADSALRLVDEAASLLRKGISTSANSSEKARFAAKKKAHTLLNKASISLSEVLDQGTSVLRKVDRLSVFGYLPCQKRTRPVGRDSDLMHGIGCCGS